MQFTLRGAFMTLFSAAVGLSTLTPGGANWQAALVTAVLVWIVLGVVRQAGDLAATYRGRGDLSQNQRWGWRFAVFWRLGLAAMLVGSYLVTVLVAKGLLHLVPSDPDFFEPAMVGIVVRRSLVDLAVLIIVCSVARRRKPPVRLSWSRCLEALGMAAGAVLCLLLVIHDLLIPTLVHLATLSIEHSFPLRSAIPGVDLDYAARSIRFFNWSVFAVTMVAVNLLLVRQVAQQWAKGRLRRWLWGAFLAVGIAASGGYALWAGTVGLWSVSPFLPEGWREIPWHVWPMAIMLVAVAASVGAYRLVRGPAVMPELPWHRHPGQYYHERPLVLGSLIAVLLLEIVAPPLEALGPVRGTLWLILSAWEYFLVTPNMYLRIAVILAAIGALWASCRRPKEASLPGPPELPLGPFAATWLALFLTVVFGATAIAALGFAIWIVPWPWH